MMSYYIVSVAYHHSHARKNDNKYNYVFHMSVIRIMLLTFTIISLGHHSEAKIFRSSCRKDALFKVKIRNGKLTSGILISKHTHGLDKCVKSCIDGSPCISINFRKADGLCELLKKDSSTATAQATPGWNNYEPIYMVRIQLSCFYAAILRQRHNVRLVKFSCYVVSHFDIGGIQD